MLTLLKALMVIAIYGLALILVMVAVVIILECASMDKR